MWRGRPRPRFTSAAKAILHLHPERRPKVLRFHSLSCHPELDAFRGRPSPLPKSFHAFVPFKKKKVILSEGERPSRRTPTIFNVPTPTKGILSEADPLPTRSKNHLSSEG